MIATLHLLLSLAFAADPAPAPPGPGQPWLDAGVRAIRGGDVPGAITAYDRCLQVEPTLSACWWELGWARWKQQDWDGVLAAWAEVRRLAPATPELDAWTRRAEQSREAVHQSAAMEAQLAARPPSPRPPRVPRVDAPATLRLRAVGDVMMGSDYAPPELPPDDGASILRAVTPWLADADLTFANLEGPLCDSGTTEKCLPSESCYAFRTPTRYGRYLKDAGIDLISTANNHAVDFGEACRAETERTLDGLGLAYSGRPGTVAWREVRGQRIAMIGFHTSESGHLVTDLTAAAALVREVDATADLVIVSFHGGAEGTRAVHVPHGVEMFLGEHRGDLRAFSRAVIDAGADLVLGHGPHVPRGMELVDGRLVAYSLGNFATYAKFNLKGHLSTSLVLEVELAADGRFVAGRILPVRQHGKGVPAPDPENTAITLIRDLSWQDFPETAVRVGDDGSFGP